MPLNGPYVRNLSLPSSTDSQIYDFVSGYKTLPIASQPTAYSSMHGDLQISERTGSAEAGKWDLNTGACQSTWNMVQHQRDRNSAGTEAIAAYNLAYQRWQDNVGETGDIGTFLAECQEAFEMVGGRAAQLTTAYRNLRSGDFRKFCRGLRVRPRDHHSRTKWTRPRDASAIWLEYWFGWAPAVGDIFGAYEVLCQDLPYSRVIGSATRPIHRHSLTSGLGTYPFSRLDQFDGKVSVKIKTDAKVTNPNVFLLNRLGLTNPAYVAWAVMPWSFIVNWFANADQVIRSWTDDFGLIHSNPEIMTYVRGVSDHDWFETFSPKRFVATAGWHAAKRVLSTPPRPTLVVQLPDRASWTRALTAMSLLVQVFTRG